MQQQSEMLKTPRDIISRALTPLPAATNMSIQDNISLSNGITDTLPKIVRHKVKAPKKRVKRDSLLTPTTPMSEATTFAAAVATPGEQDSSEQITVGGNLPTPSLCLVDLPTPITSKPLRSMTVSKRSPRSSLDHPRKMFKPKKLNLTPLATVTGRVVNNKYVVGISLKRAPLKPDPLQVLWHPKSLFSKTGKETATDYQSSYFASPQKVTHIEVN